MSDDRRQHSRRVLGGARLAVAAAATAGCVGLMGLVATEARATTSYPVTATIPIGSAPRSIAVDPSLHRVYVTSPSGVSVIDESGDASSGTVISTITTTDTDTYGAALDPSDHNLYILDPRLSAMSVIDESGDAATGTVTSTVGVGYGSDNLAVDSASHDVYVTSPSDPNNLYAGFMHQVDESGDANTGTETGSFSFPAESFTTGVAVDPSTHTVYVANPGAGSDAVSVIDESGDARSGTITATVRLPAGSAPSAVAVDPTLHDVYIADSGSNTVSVLDESGDARSGTVIATIPVGGAAVAVDPSTHTVYVAGGNTVSVIDESGDADSGTVIATVPVGSDPSAIAVDPSSHSVYVANQGSDTVSVISPELAIDGQGSAQALNTATAHVSSAAAGDLLVAFVAADSPAGGGQSATVSGGGLTWTLAGRENASRGDAEIWTARATGALINTAITAKLKKTGWDESITVIAFANAAGAGRVATFASAHGAPSGTLSTSQPDSWVFAVGDDWAHSTPRRPGPGQTLINQTTDTAGDTYWTQATNAITPAAGTPVTINDTAPTSDPYYLVLVEIL